MPIHPIDGKPLIRVETNVGGELVDLEDTDYRHKEYKRISRLKVAFGM